jgi:catechol 2,3-dioxygenase-like lactoylglutathione lyase family enzyme
VDFNPSVERFAMDRAKAYIDQGAYFGAHNILLVIGEYYWDGEVFPNEAIWGFAVDRVRRLGGYAQSKGLEVVIELEPFTQALVKDVDAEAQRLRAAGATILKGPVDRAWGHRTLHVEDPDGFVVELAEEIPRQPSQGRR